MNKSQPLIGVCIPTFKDGNYLFEAVDSILNQTYKNFVIYILNDGSDLKWHNLYKKTFLNNKKIFYYYQKNSGIVASSQKLLDFCNKNKKVQLIARMDADDISHPERFKQQVAYILKKNCDLVSCHFRRMNSNKKIFEENLAPINNKNFVLHLFVGSPFAHGSILFKKKILNENVNYDKSVKSLIFPEDYNFYLKCYYNNIKVGSVNKFLYYHRYHYKSFSMVNNLIYNKSLIKIRSIFMHNNFFILQNLLKQKLENILYVKIILLKIILIHASQLNFKFILIIIRHFNFFDFVKILKFYCKRKIMKYIYG